MWKLLLIGCAAATSVLAQSVSPLDVANLHEDVRGLQQRVGDLALRVEQLERENADLRNRLTNTGGNYVTVTQLNAATEDLNRAINGAVAASQKETLERVAVQMEKLAKETNAALDSIAKAQAVARPAAETSFGQDYAKEGNHYIVQKGDTLALIAKKTGARVRDIVNANKLTDPSHIFVGQSLFIPNPPKGVEK